MPRARWRPRAVAPPPPGSRWQRLRHRPALHCGRAHRAATAARQRRPRVRAHPGCGSGGRSCSRVRVPPAPASRLSRRFAAHGRRRVAPAAPGPRAGAPRQRRMLAAGSVFCELPPCCWPPARPSRSAPATARCRTRLPRQPRWRAAARLSFEFLVSSDAPVLKTTHGRSASGDQEVASCPTVPQSLRHALRRERASEKRRDPPRRSGEGQPLRAFGSGRTRARHRIRQGKWTEALLRSAPQQRGRQRQHHAAGTVAMAAVEIHGAERFAVTGVGGQVWICVRAVMSRRHQPRACARDDRSALRPGSRAHNTTPPPPS